MRKVILLTAMPKESVWSSSIYVNGGGLLSSKISFSRILLLFVCCIFCNNVFADDDEGDWQTIQNFESSPTVTASYSSIIRQNYSNNTSNDANDVASCSVVTASILYDNIDGIHGNFTKVAGLSKTFQGNDYSYGIVFVVSLGSNNLSDYKKIKLDTYTTDNYKPLCVYVRQSGTNNSFKKLFVLGNGFGQSGQWRTNGDQNTEQPINTEGMDYSNVEFYIGYVANEKLDVYIDNIQLYGPAIASSSVDISESADNTITAKYYDTVRLYRTLTAGMWNTICLPFAPTPEQADAIFGEDAKFAEFKSVSNGVMQFTSVTGSLEAGKPYLVLPTENRSADDEVVLTGVTIPASATDAGHVTHNDDTGYYTFQGIYRPTSFAQGEWSATRFVGSNNNLLKPNTASGALRALRAYFTVPVPGASGGAKNYTFAVDSFVPTSIANIQIEGDGDGAIYNIGGQRVEGKSLPKGIYIRDGKKFVVK